jgi:hypothetical protein
MSADDQLDLETYVKMESTSPADAARWAREQGRQMADQQGDRIFRFVYRKVEGEPGMLQAIFTFPCPVKVDELPPELTGRAAIEHLARWAQSMIQELVQNQVASGGNQDDQGHIVS